MSYYEDYKTISDQSIREFINERRSFILENVDRLDVGEAVERIEKIIELCGLSCRVYTRGRVLGGLWSLPITALGIIAHNIATWNPDYEIGKNFVEGNLKVTYKK